MLTLLASTFLAVVVVYLTRKVLAYQKMANELRHIPGHRMLIEPHSVLGHIIRRIPGGCSDFLGLTLSTHFVHAWGHDIYEKEGWDIRSFINVFPSAAKYIFIADAAAAKEIANNKTRFPKPMKFYDALTFFGENIVASEGAQWKKFRKISAPAFTEPNNKLVCEETMRTMNELFDGMWKDKKSVTVDHCLDITLPITLFVISRAGFGQNISWGNDDDIPSGHTMSFKTSMEIMSTDFFIPLILPNWALGISKRTRDAGQALIELRKHLLEMIHRRLHSEKVERRDLLSLLLEENSQHLNNASLNDDELIGNIFIFLIAGYETTSHSLTFSLGLLALYQDEQEKMYQQTKSVLGDRAPTYADVNSLTYAMAVFMETLRLFAPISAVAKYATEDTVLTIHNAEGQSKPVAIPQGSYVNIHVKAIHDNPRYWPDPKAFKPERFLDPNWPRDAFLPFSTAARGCLGRRFGEIEAVTVLTAFVAKYKITVKEEPQFAHETFEQRKERVLACDTGMSVTPTRVPLVFTRR